MREDDGNTGGGEGLRVEGVGRFGWVGVPEDRRGEK